MTNIEFHERENPIIQMSYEYFCIISITPEFYDLFKSAIIEHVILLFLVCIMDHKTQMPACQN